MFYCFAGRTNIDDEQFKRYKICMREDLVSQEDGFVNAAVTVYNSLMLLNPGLEPEHLGLRKSDGRGLLIQSLPRCRLPYWMPRHEIGDTEEATVCVDEYAP